jgi:hypothetical protein
LLPNLEKSLKRKGKYQIFPGQSSPIGLASHPGHTFNPFALDAEPKKQRAENK